MTCREFKHAATGLTLWEVSRLRDEVLLDHAEQCQKCSAWLDQQQVLAVTMQTLQTQTAGLQAGPHVERALLGVFRQTPFEATQPNAAYRFTPLAWRLSRFFEVGAYAAAAAAVAVGLFLGVRLLQQRPSPSAAQTRMPTVSAPGPVMQANVNPASQPTVPAATNKPAAAIAKRGMVTHLAARRIGAGPTTAVPALPADDTGYVALMFCDPLICSTDAQVVRMELPVAGVGSEGDAQTEVADVVVGYDGLVRAIRVVNGNMN